MKWRCFITILCSVLLSGSVSTHAQGQSGIPHTVIKRLNIQHASQASWSPDGSRLAVTAWPTIQIFDTRSWKLLLTIPDAPAVSNKWSPTGKMLAGVRGGDA